MVAELDGFEEVLEAGFFFRSVPQGGGRRATQSSWLAPTGGGPVVRDQGWPWGKTCCPGEAASGYP
jgi:hypothetical protein